MNLLFLGVGLLGGITTARPHSAPPPPVPEAVPAAPELAPPATEPPAGSASTSAPDTEEAMPEPVADIPLVAVETPAVAFAVPVAGATILAPLRLTSPAPVRPTTLPTAITTAPPAPPRLENFSPQGKPGFPLPDYPAAARTRGWQGEVLLRIAVGANGLPATVTVERSSGHPLLDRHAVEHVQRRWTWPTGEARRYLAPIIFQLQ